MEKFVKMEITADGSERASVNLGKLKTLWFNTGTLCNLECANCYIESSPKNDRLAYISAAEVEEYLQEIASKKLPVDLIGLTGGEPFLNPEIMDILSAILKFGHEVLVLTNATRVMRRHQNALLELLQKHGDALKIRVSLDHFTQEAHEGERGPNTFQKAIDQLKWLYDNDFEISIAGRSLMDEDQQSALRGYGDLLMKNGIEIDLGEKLVVFPEMKSEKEVPEITTACWNILNKSPDDQMCASERMIVKRKGEPKPVVMPCTLLAFDEKFILGQELSSSEKKVYLNHKFCAEFCVLGGASCSSTK